MIPKLTALLCLLVLLFCSGCGYHVAGKAVRLPSNVQTISIPTFASRTSAYRVEQMLTEAVVREFGTRTRFVITPERDYKSDAMLNATVTAIHVAPVTFDSKTGRASTAQVTLSMEVELVDQLGKVLFSNKSYVFREQYQISREVSSFFEEESPALDRMSRDAARDLVSNVLEGF